MPYPIGYHHIIMPLSCHHHYHICPTLYTCLCAYVLGEEKNLTPQHDIFQGGHHVVIVVIVIIILRYHSVVVII